MILPRGITGFHRVGHDAPPPTVDPRTFARACHAAARAESGQIAKFEPAGVARNYHRATFRHRAAAIAVLCNAHFPWIAFAEASDDLPLRFREATPLAARIQDAMACEVVSLSVLEAAPAAELLADLSAAEREQVRSWRPHRLGDLLFNVWD